MFTWIDLIVVLIVAIYVVDGYRQGFVKQTFDLLGIVLSFLVALKFYPVMGTLLGSWGLGPNLTQPIGFFILWTLVQIIFYLIGFFIFRHFPDQIQSSGTNKSFGLLIGALKGTLIVSIFLILVMVLPVGNKTKEMLSSSFLTGHLIKATASVESRVSTALWQMNNSLGFIGEVPQNGAVSNLGFKTDNYQIDAAAEKQMVSDINSARSQAGLKPLTEDLLLRNVARAHAIDMVMKGYFSHNDLQGVTPSDRLTLAGAQFRVDGENLALAPTEDLAMIGLMNSPEHRQNILDPAFNHVGVGVLDLGSYGKIFTQVFTD